VSAARPGGRSRWGAAALVLSAVATVSLTGDVPGRDVPGRDVPGRDVPGRDVPGRDGPPVDQFQVGKEDGQIVLFDRLGDPDVCRVFELSRTPDSS
jgi:hypothetical protein